MALHPSSEMPLVYLDQNYASRIAKHLMEMEGHAHFGRVFDVMRHRELIAPPSPFHVLELRGGYLQPMFEEFFAQISHGAWVRPWQELLSLQVEHRRVAREDFLTDSWDWTQPATSEPLDTIVHLPLEGSFAQRTEHAQDLLLDLLSAWVAPCEDGFVPAFVEVLAELLAFRSLNEVRQPQDSDLIDLLMAASVRPYVSILATDRFMREGLEQIGRGEGVFSGRRHEVNALEHTLDTFEIDEPATSARKGNPHDKDAIDAKA